MRRLLGLWMTGGQMWGDRVDVYYYVGTLQQFFYYYYLPASPTDIYIVMCSGVTVEIGGGCKFPFLLWFLLFFFPPLYYPVNPLSFPLEYLPRGRFTYWITVIFFIYYYLICTNVLACWVLRNFHQGIYYLRR